MSTYRAWDENDYPWPPPDGWYEGSDAKWWPEGYGPGPGTVIESAASAPAPAPAPAPSNVAPPPVAAPPVAAPAPAAGFAPPPAAAGFAPPAAGGVAPPPAAAYAAPAAAAPPLSQAYAASPSPAPSTNGSGGGSTGKILAGVGGLVALLAVAVVGFFVFAGGDDDPDTTTGTTVPVATLGGDDDTTGTTAAGASTGTGIGSFENPYAIGDGVVLFYEDNDTGEERRWLVEVLGPIEDISQAVADENQFNDPPPAGEVFAAARVRITYEAGPAPADVFDLNFSAIGPSGRVLKTFEATCGVTPDSLDAFAELFPGGSVEGSICWATPATDLPDMRMILEASGVDGQVYVRLN